MATSMPDDWMGYLRALFGGCHLGNRLTSSYPIYTHLDRQQFPPLGGVLDFPTERLRWHRKPEACQLISRWLSARNARHHRKRYRRDRTPAGVPELCDPCRGRSFRNAYRWWRPLSWSYHRLIYFHPSGMMKSPYNKNSLWERDCLRNSVASPLRPSSVSLPSSVRNAPFPNLAIWFNFVIWSCLPYQNCPIPSFRLHCLCHEPAFPTALQPAPARARSFRGHGRARAYPRRAGTDGCNPACLGLANR